MNQDLNYILTTSSGTANQTVSGYKNRKLVLIYVKPFTASTQYDLFITDKNSAVIYKNTGVVGTFIDTTNLPTYTYGNFTFSLANATADEAFTLILVFSEEAF